MLRQLTITMLGAGLMITAPAQAAGNPQAGKTKSAVCQACHGPDGNSTDHQFPRLAGQYPDYLVHALKAYKSGDRKNPIMSGFAATLSETDMEDLASYYAGQKGVHVPDHD